MCVYFVNVRDFVVIRNVVVFDPPFRPEKGTERSHCPSCPRLPPHRLLLLRRLAHLPIAIFHLSASLLSVLSEFLSKAQFLTDLTRIHIQGFLASHATTQKISAVIIIKKASKEEARA